MKVIELIELLESCELDSEVYVSVNGNVFMQIRDAYDAQTDNGENIVVIQ